MNFLSSSYKSKISTIVVIGLFLFSTNSQATYLATLAYDGVNTPTQDSNNSATEGTVLLSTSSYDVTQDARHTASSAKARAEFGHLGVELVSSLSIGSGAGGQAGVSSRAVATYGDVVQVTSSADLTDGFVRQIFSLEGDLTHNSSFAFDWGFARVSFNARNASGSAAGSWVREITTNTDTITGSLVADFAIGSDGFWRPFVDFAAEVSCGLPTNSVYDCNTTAEFFNSITVGAATVYDANGVVVNNVSMLADSGFDYTVGYQSPGSIPEPATIALLGLGIAGLSLTRRKAKA